MRALFASKGNVATTLACLALLAWAIPPLGRWLVLDAAWSGGPDACREAAGACWTYIGHKLGFFVFGFYPADARWRPGLALLLLLALLAGSLVPRCWTARLLLAWPATLAAVLWLLGGGGGLPAVSAEQWSGLPLTVLIASCALVAGFPLGLLLALGRVSALPFFRLLCTAFIELQRGLPLVSLLFMASVMMPLLLPAGITPGKLLRAYAAYTLLVSALIAEVVRGGLQAVPKGQAEAASALGLGYWRTMGQVVLPQVLRLSVPSLVGIAISLFKDTSLVVVIGLSDFLGAVGGGARDPAWLGHDVEGYVFAGAVYFTICLTASRYAAWLERRVGGTVRNAARVAGPAALPVAAVTA